MIILNKIFNAVWEHYFNIEALKAQRTRKTHNLDSAKRVGILFDASEESSYKKVSEFVRCLQNEKKTVKVVGYVNMKFIPHYCIPMLSYDFYTKKDVNWFKKPTKACIQDFIHEDFDILIDLNLDDCVHSQWISGLSQAKFKVGLYSKKNQKYFDFMIKPEIPTGLNEFLKQIIHYLSKLNSETNEQKI